MSYQSKKTISKFSELEEREGVLEMRGFKIHDIRLKKPITAEIGNASTDVISETHSISDLAKQQLSQLNLSEEETESFLEIMKNYGINVTS